MQINQPFQSKTMILLSFLAEPRIVCRFPNQEKYENHLKEDKDWIEDHTNDICYEIEI